MLSKIKNILGRMFLLYGLLGLGLFYFTDLQRAWNHMVPCTLSRLIPDYDYLVAFDKDRSKIDVMRLGEFERYFAKVAQYMDTLPDAPALRGFCLHYLGQERAAEKAYEQAIHRYQNGFNFHYNLAVMAFQRHDYTKAREHLKNSLAVDPIENIRFIVSSHVYRPFLPHSHDAQRTADAVGIYVVESYRKANLLLLRTCFELKDYSAMLMFAQKSLTNQFPEKGELYYYAGLAAYELREYSRAVHYIQEAIKLNFKYAEAFEIWGLSLQALHRLESDSALAVSVSLKKNQKTYQKQQPIFDLLVY